MSKENSMLFASVIIRSYNRIDACIELLNILLRQNYRQFEVIVVEQSTIITKAQQTELERLSSAYDNLKIVNYPPLGPAGARNKGWQQATGDILIFCDDDDLPLSTSWLSNHMANYTDPDIIGVTGRQILAPEEKCGYSNPQRANRMCLSYDFWGYPNAYCRLDQRVEKVDWLHGGNSSARRNMVVTVDGWYEKLNDHEEHSFAFKLAKHMKQGQRLVFDPKPCILRRKNIPGGLDRQDQTPRDFYYGWFLYLHRVIARYRPIRVIILYPIYILWLLGISIHNIWKRPGKGAHRFLLTMKTFFINPFWFVHSWFSMLKGQT